MLDTINGDDDSDRLLVRWRLRSPQVVAACAWPRTSRRPSPTSSPPARWSRSSVSDARRAGAGRPRRGDRAGRRAAATSSALRSDRPGRSPQRWRVAVREALGAARSADGGRIDGFDRAGWYVVQEGDR